MPITLADLRQALCACYAKSGHTDQEIEYFEYAMTQHKSLKRVLDAAIRQFHMTRFDFRLSAFCDIDDYALRYFIVAWASTSRCEECIPKTLPSENADSLINICLRLGIPFFPYLSGLRKHRVPSSSRGALHEIARALESMARTGTKAKVGVQIQRKKRRIRLFGLLAAVCSAKRWEAVASAPLGQPIKIESRILRPSSPCGKNLVTVTNTAPLARRLCEKTNATLAKLYNIVEDAKIVP